MSLSELTPEQWTQIGYSALLIVLTAVLGRWLIRLVLGQVLKRLTRQTETQLDDTILQAVRGPLFWLALIVAVQVALGRLAFLDETLTLALDDVYFTVYLVTGFVLVWRLTTGLAQWYGQEVAPRTDSTVDDQLVPFMRRIFQIVLVALVAIMLLSHFEVDVSGLVATLGIGSLAIALAAQESLSDTISGFIIMIDRPFRVGDRIEIQDLDTWGDVVDIGLRSSRIRTRDNRMVIVPNSVIGKSLIVNYSYPDPVYRIQIELGVGYGTDIEKARRVIIDAVRKVEGVLPDRPVEALFLHFGDSALIFRVRWWLDSYVDTRRMFDSVNTAMYQALNEAGIELPFPQWDIHHKIDPADRKNIVEVIHGPK